MTYQLDTRLKLILIVLSHATIAFHLSILWQMIAIILIWAVMAYCGIYQALMKSIATAIFFLIGSHLPMLSHNMFFHFIAYLSHIGFILVPIGSCGLLLIYTTTIPQLLLALRQMKLPEPVVLLFFSLFRFLPTMYQEAKPIFHAMKLRGLWQGFWTPIIHPLKTFEYFIIPYLMLALRTADDLSQAAVTRGLKINSPKTTLVTMHWQKQDTVILLLFLIYIIGAIVSKFGGIL